MKTRQDLIQDIVLRLEKERKENWQFFHEAQLWKEQKENAEIYNDLIKKIREIL